MDVATLKVLDKVYRAYADVYTLDGLSDEDRQVVVASGAVPKVATFKHAAVINELAALGEKINLKKTADRFLASFGSAPLRQRTSLVCLLYARALPAHRFKRRSANDPSCMVCGMEATDSEQIGWLTYVRHRHGSTPWFGGGGAIWSLLDLREVADMPAVKPTKDDAAAFQRILDTIASLDANASQTVVRKNLSRKLHNLPELLGRIGILETDQQKGYFSGYQTFWDLQQRPNARSESDPPICFWKRRDGFNARAIKALFGHRGVKSP